MEKFLLKIVSAIAIDGVIHKAGSVIEVAENVAKDLLRRGKAIAHAVVEAAEHLVDEDLGGDNKPAEGAETDTSADADATDAPKSKKAAK